MNPLDVIAQPFIERDFNTPHIDKAIESALRNRKKCPKSKDDAKHEVLQDHG